MNLTSEVWRLHGVVGSEPGLLVLHDDGEVELHLEGDDGAPRSVFRTPAAAISDVKWPKTQFSGGCSFVVDGEKYRLSFLQPQNTRVFATSALGAAQGLGSISGGRKAGKAWKSALGS